MQVTYYGFIEETWELAYGPLKVALFAASGSGSRKSTLTAKGSLPLISLRPHTETTLSSLQEMLCKSSMQVFYARDNKTKGRLKVVLEGKRKIVGVDGVTNEEDYRGYQ